MAAVIEGNMVYDTLLYEEDERVALITLNRPHVLNAFNVTLQSEIHDCWQRLRRKDDIHAVIITGAGERAFCTGVDRKEAYATSDYEANSGSGPPGDSPFMFDSVAPKLGPKSNDYWKPVIAAVNGMAAGGAFYLLGESDIIIAAEHATFFDPHVSYGMTAAFEAAEFARRMPLGELARMLLLGNHERLTAQRAWQVGLVSEVVPAEELLHQARWIATRIAEAPPLAVQGTLRALWAAYEQPRSDALALAPMFLALGNRRQDLLEGNDRFTDGPRPGPRLR